MAERVSMSGGTDEKSSSSPCGKPIPPRPQDCRSMRLAPEPVRRRLAGTDHVAPRQLLTRVAHPDAVAAPARNERRRLSAGDAPKLRRVRTRVTASPGCRRVFAEVSRSTRDRGSPSRRHRESSQTEIASFAPPLCPSPKPAGWWPGASGIGAAPRQPRPSQHARDRPWCRNSRSRRTDARPQPR